ncbi:NAD(P)-dependent alcohol dehydrogenase [Phytomonospora endophytica]|uniref:alcohol dehydrogenase (NADP(+)) n=1 Tax=Phytomonospora endophytica TaxID=714109 RepID=A0A841FDU4_9ACTN|nr:NAD(P)-dependent alcohol dehydrogenase [Phytomonospora endophytica]MBB6034446.1 putative zinc-type alcohol dehydrogenase-like protein [Phytomonospora endophytica]GIG66840.1 dehydrogenase [Phytomonospora endophytica]
MTTEVRAYAASSAGAPLAPTTIPRRAVGEHDVLIEIRYSGICHSDIHQVRDEWRPGNYPMVPGHEIVGVVTGAGAGVTRHKVGDRVGIGCFVFACGECDACKAGLDQYCRKGTATYNDTEADGSPAYGGYSTHIVANEDFVLKVPESIDYAGAAPLLCAGITLYSPLRHWGAGPGKKVAIVGMGGLGHVGVKLAHAMGAEVTVLSQTLSKKEDGLRLGADHFHATSDPETFRRLTGRFDLIVNTVSADLDLDAFLRLLRIDGTMVNLGLPSEASSVRLSSLIGGRKSLAGSMIGGIAETQEMLDFCAERGIAAEYELIRAEAINEAYERVLASDVRYRFVIDAESF